MMGFSLRRFVTYVEFCFLLRSRSLKLHIPPAWTLLDSFWICHLRWEHYISLIFVIHLVLGIVNFPLFRLNLHRLLALFIEIKSGRCLRLQLWQVHLISKFLFGLLRLPLLLFPAGRYEAFLVVACKNFFTLTEFFQLSFLLFSLLLCSFECSISA